MADKKYIMTLSPEESRDILGMLQKSLRNAEKMIEKAVHFNPTSDILSLYGQGCSFFSLPRP